MIDTLIKDLGSEITEAEAEGKLAQEEYEELMSDSAAKRASDSKSVTDKEGVKANTEAALAADETNLKDTKSELMATTEYEASLHALLPSLVLQEEQDPPRAHSEASTAEPGFCPPEPSWPCRSSSSEERREEEITLEAPPGLCLPEPFGPCRDPSSEERREVEIVQQPWYRQPMRICHEEEITTSNVSDWCLPHSLQGHFQCKLHRLLAVDLNMRICCSINLCAQFEKLEIALHSIHYLMTRRL